MNRRSAIAAFFEIPRIAPVLDLRVPDQFSQLASAHSGTEEIARDLRQLVSLVHDETVRVGKQFPESLFPQ